VKRGAVARSNRAPPFNPCCGNLFISGVAKHRIVLDSDFSVPIVW